jgi:hypothetical protein
VSPAALRVLIIPEPVGVYADPPSYGNVSDRAGVPAGRGPRSLASRNATKGEPASRRPLYSPMLSISHIDYGPPHLAK